MSKKLIKCFDANNNLVLTLELPEDVKEFDKIVSLKIFNEKPVVSTNKNRIFAEKLYYILYNHEKSYYNEAIICIKNDIISFFKFGYGDNEWIKGKDQDYIIQNLMMNIEEYKINDESDMYDILEVIKVDTPKETLTLKQVYLINKLFNTKAYIDEIDYNKINKSIKPAKKVISEVEEENNTGNNEEKKGFWARLFS